MTTSLHPGGPLVMLDDLHLTLGSAAGPVNILRGISLEIGAGETVSVVGPSGSGKSTLMMVLGGLEQPTSGRVRIDGVDLGGLDEDSLARFRRVRIGIVFQSFHLLPTMTALENVAIPLELGRSNPPSTIINVDFPEPDGPTMLTVSPAPISSEIPRRILTGPAALPSVR